jgi:hypothetical protein
MFCFSCKYFDGSPVKQTVDSILTHHPDEKIVIVDSMSDDKSYYQIFSNYDNVDILDNCNSYRVPGAFYQTVKKYPNEPYYVNLQDSLMLKKSWQKFVDSPVEFISLVYFHDIILPEDRHEYQYMKKVFSGTEYNIPNPGDSFNACFGPVYIIKNSLAMKFYNCGLLENMKSTCKIHDETGERIFGYLAMVEGFDPEIYNMEGEIISQWNKMVNDQMNYYTKNFCSKLGRT